MNSLAFFSCLILFIVCVSLSFIRNIHYFQQNTYHYSEHISWIKKNYHKFIFNGISLLYIIILLLFDESIAYFALDFLFLLSLPYCLPLRKAKKPLVFTNRLVRMIITASVIVILTVFCAVALPSPYNYILLCFIFTIVPILPLIVNFINTPIESNVRKYYINDAKKILKDCPNLIIIGITGSYGKTSVKYFLTTLLRAKYNVLMTPESFNTPMGVVKTIREQLKPTHEIFVCEMGAKFKGDIKELCDIVHPTHGIITSIGEQHLETFKSIENIIKTKFELADAVADKGILLLNGDNCYISEHITDQEQYTYGISEKNDYHAMNIHVSQSGTDFSFSYDGKETCMMKTKLIGEHNVVNLMGAIAMAKHLGVTDNQIKSQLIKLEAPPHRLQLTRNGDTIIIDDAYNSNPSGSKAALKTLSLFEGYKIIVTPGMIDLGSKQDELNFNLGVYAAEICDFIILVGEKQAKPIYDGIISTGYDKSKVFISSGIKEAIKKACTLQVNDKKIILLENDLPDNYL